MLRRLSARSGAVSSNLVPGSCFLGFPRFVPPGPFWENLAAGYPLVVDQAPYLSAAPAPCVSRDAWRASDGTFWLVLFRKVVGLLGITLKRGSRMMAMTAFMCCMDIYKPV